MYKSKIFDTFYDLKNFLNDKEILPTEIISISTCSRGIALVYFDADKERD